MVDTRKEELVEWFRAFGTVALKSKNAAISQVAYELIESLGMDALLIADKIAAGVDIPMKDFESDYVTMREE